MKNIVQSKGLIAYIRESNKPRDSKGKYCKRTTLKNAISLEDFENIIKKIDNRNDNKQHINN